MNKSIILAAGSFLLFGLVSSAQVLQSATSSVDISSSGAGTSSDYYGSGADDGFEEYGIATFTTFDASDFGGPISGLASATYSLTVNDRTFSDGSELVFVLSTDQFGGDYSALSFDAAANPANGLNPAQYTNPVFVLGVYNLGADMGTFAGGTVIDFDLVLSAGAEAALVSSINAGTEFSLSIHANSQTDDITFSGVGNTFDPGDPALTLTAVPEPSVYAMLLGLAGLGFVVVRRRR